MTELAGLLAHAACFGSKILKPSRTKACYQDWRVRGSAPLPRIRRVTFGPALLTVLCGSLQRAIGKWKRSSPALSQRLRQTAKIRCGLAVKAQDCIASRVSGFLILGRTMVF